VAAHLLALERVYKRASDFDIVHFHIDYLHFFVSRRHSVPHVTTLHGRLDIPHLVPIFEEYHEVPVVSISNAQRRPLPWLNYAGTVYHGLPPDLFAFHDEPGKYLAFLGRISPEKCPDRAIEIAKRTGLPLKIAAKVDPVDREYFEEVIRPLLSHPLIEYVGEIGDAEKGEFLGNAYALLFPIDWPEPFGLVMIEAMACGTPVIACCHGSVPEVMEEGVTGFVVDDVDQAVAAVGRVASLSRARCRQVFEERFTVSRMAEQYVALYQALQPDVISQGHRATARKGHERYHPTGEQVLHSGKLASG
jgi:glycosyltransferase involved in cell wall biosynthesis